MKYKDKEIVEVTDEIGRYACMDCIFKYEICDLKKMKKFTSLCQKGVHFEFAQEKPKNKISTL